MPNIGATELLVIFAVAILLFGYKKLPEVGKGLGHAIRNFRRSLSEPEEIDITPRKNGPENDKKNKS
jgi:sec-independent protein translocase protein TatA